MAKKKTEYRAILREIFRRHYKKGVTKFVFSRSEIAPAAKVLGMELPANLGDLLYSFRFRAKFPKEIVDTVPKGKEWIIELAGRGKYRFRLANASRIVPRPDLVTIKVPDATPEIIAKYAMNDEQAVLAKVRYNRLIDVFLGITTYSLQNHLRTSVAGMGQIEIDEIYVGVNRHGTQFVVPVQAKAGRDQIGSVQAAQDVACCSEKFPELICRPVAAQFLKGDVIALLELTRDGAEVRVVDERHYKLVPADAVTKADLTRYRKSDPSAP